MANQGTAAGGKAQIPGLGDFPAQISPTQVGASAGSAVGAAAHELQMVEGCGLLTDGLQARLLAGACGRAAPGGFGNLHVSSLSQLAHGFGEGQVLCLHDVAEGVAAFSAAEAMPQLSHGVHLEGGGLFAMKRAAAPKIPALLPHRGGFANVGDQVRGLPDLRDVFVANKSCHRCFAPLQPSPSDPTGQTPGSCG